MKRLIRKASDDDMTLDEMRHEAYQAIAKMETNVNDWSVRDILTRMTSWGFYQGEMMASIDDETAMEIIDQLKDYVDSIETEDAMDEVLNTIGRYAH